MASTTASPTSPGRPAATYSPARPADAAARDEAGRPARPAARRERTFAALVTAVFAIVVALALAHHEPWADEWQAWLLARDSRSVAGLLHAMRYEGHPAAWYLLLYAVSRLGRAVQLMQATHLVLAAAAVYVVARYAPFSRTTRALLAGGYFFAYEYAVISREYVIGLLALVLACALFRLRRRSYLPLALALSLLANSSAYGLMFAFAFAVTLVLEWCTDAGVRAGRGRHPADPLLAGALLLAMAVVSMRTILPPPDATFVAGVSHTGPLLSAWVLAERASLVWRAYVPIPSPHAPVFWESNILTYTGLTPQLLRRLIPAALLVAGAALAMVRRPLVLFLYLFGTALVVAFTYFVNLGTLRHHGHLFLLLVACAWLSRSDVRRLHVGPGLRALLRRAERVASPAFKGLLVLQVVAAAMLLAHDWRARFSSGGDAAAFLRRAGLADVPVAVTPTPAGISLSGYLDRPVHYITDGVVGTYVVWGEQSGDWVTPVAFDRLRELLAAGQPRVVLAVNTPLAGPAPPDLVVRPLGSFTAAMMPGERYTLYEVSRAPAADSRQSSQSTTPSSAKMGSGETPVAAKGR
ncbi:MAG TPA: hypothetical protein VFS08_14500 [Gemmatimonadaceae bacterium]|nr:hypothetical protein [Gemmatimonadaceae bacterium]